MTPNEYTFRYRVRNWPDDNRALMARGRLTFWFDEETISAWQNTEPRNAVPRESVDPPDWLAMGDATLPEIQKLGRYPWRLSSGGTRQSLAENAMSRFKASFGPKLSARGLDNQQTEAIIKGGVLNRMQSRGRPQSVRIQ